MPSSTLPFCTPTDHFLVTISDAFHTCIPTPLALISISLGSLSVLIWLFAQLPQVYKNYRLKSTSGLSVLFVFEWFFADLSNLLGAVLTRQAGWQVLIGAYFFIVDVSLLVQFCLYKGNRPLRLEASLLLASEDDLDGGEEENDADGAGGSALMSSELGGRSAQGRKGAVSISGSTTPSARGGFAYEKLKGNSMLSATLESTQDRRPSSWLKSIAFFSTAASVVSLGPQVAAAAVLPVGSGSAPLPSTGPLPTSFSPFSGSQSRTAVLVGTTLSWASAVLYLMSRLPQLHKNYTRKSTSGLSPLLFLAAFCGNLTYSTSILTNPNAWQSFPPHGGHGWADSQGSDRTAWIHRALPFWLGSAGTLLIDGLIGLQFALYRRRDATGEEKNGDDQLLVPAEAAEAAPENPSWPHHLRRVLINPSSQVAQWLFQTSSRHNNLPESETRPLLPRGRSDLNRIE